MDAEPKYERWQLELINDPRSTAELINLALIAPDEDALWDIVRVLHYRGTREVFEAGRELCQSDCPQERELGAFVLSQLGVPDRIYVRQCVEALLAMLHDEAEPRVLGTVLVALMHSKDNRIVPAAARFKSHADRHVRYGVVQAVTRYDDPAAITTLIELSRDSDAEVRDWATFGLGSMIDVDTPEIRAALWERVTDEENIVRAEALMGLAERGDRGIVGPLLAELDADWMGSLTVQAAELIGDPALYPALLELQSWWDVEPSTLQDAIDRCRPTTA